MNKKYNKKRFISIVVTFLFLSTVFFVSVGAKNQNIIEIIGKEDFDPLVDIEVTVEI